uniref:non-specific serine/threonine protein kinase n=1 Tax=Anopheles christyi TaxID=43041 RepID=A0A182JXN0_9DIPT
MSKFEKEAKTIAARTARLNDLILGRSNGGGADALPHDKKDSVDGALLDVALSREGLLDSLFVLYDECSKDAVKKKDKNIADFITKYRPIIQETRDRRVNVQDFDVKCLIGKGYFGEVHLVAERHTKQLYAMKKMMKETVSSIQVRAERDIMATRRSEWITPLQYAFQDSHSLYLVMEFLPGGDLLSLMIRVGVFDEELAQFYLAELTAALHSLHTMGYVHRDIKPENILLDRFGHLKLADFGNATAINDDGSVSSPMPVGTPDYIAPELLQTLSTISRTVNSAKHDVTCDFWSMGIIGYEFITEQTPFHGVNVNETYSQILEHCEGRVTRKLTFPAHVSISTSYRDLLDRLVTNVSNRISYPEIVRHPFFRDLKWDRLRYMIPPIIPTVSSDDDTSNFDDVDKTAKRKAMLGRKPTYNIARMNDFSGHDLPYLGYSYVYEELDSAAMYRDTDEHMKAARLAAKVKEQERRIKEHSGEIHRLQKDVLDRDRKIVTITAHSKILDETKKELERMKELLKEKTAELAATRTENKTLRNSLKIEKEERLKNDATIADVVKQTYKKWEKAKQASDQAYERQLAEKKTELSAANEKLREASTELMARLEECQHLQESVENYKELLKKSKDKLMADKENLDRSQQELMETYDAKIAEVKSKWKAEKEQRIGLEMEVRELRDRLQEEESNAKFVAEREQKLVDNVKRRMTMQLEENNMLREAKQFSEKMSEEMQRKNDHLRTEICKLQEEKITTVSTISSVNSSRRSSLVYEQEFRSANSSMHDMSTIIAGPNVEAQLRNDLIRARESENEQRKRAENLEEVVGRLEKVIAQLKESGTGLSGAETLLEKQKECLEDKLSAIREQAILDKQSARTANLSMWKLEKELDALRGEKSILTRRIEQSDDRVTRVRHEKEELEFKIKQQQETIANKDKQMEDLRADMSVLKDELRKERELWSNSEKDRLAEKTELIECLAKTQMLEEKLKESQLKQQQQNDRIKLLTVENARYAKELGEAQDELADATESSESLEQRLAAVTKNFNMLKGACNITETQLTEMEMLLEKESKRNKECSEQMEVLRKRLGEKDNEIERIRQELHAERSGKTLSESRTNHLLAEYEELRKKFEELQRQMVEQQKELIEKTSHLFEVQERIELLNHDAENLQKVVANYEHEHYILKEENARILTDLFLAKEHITKQSNEMREQQNANEQLIAELEHVKRVLQEQKVFYSERDIKSEATLAQHKKLIDYLQAKVEECNAHRKKKTLAGLIFGTSSSSCERKENVAPNVGAAGGVPVESTPSYKKLQEELQKERARTNQLKEQLLRAKTDLIVAEKSNTLQKKQQKDTENLEAERSYRNEDRRTATATTDADCAKQEAQVAEQQRRRTGSISGKRNTSTTTTTAKKEHPFKITIESTSSASKHQTMLCAECSRHILAGQTYLKCSDCNLNVHRKCRSLVTAGCGVEKRRSDVGCDGTGKKNESLDDFAEELGMVDEEETDVESVGRTGDRKSPSFSMTSAEEKAEEDRYVGDLLFKTKRLEPKLFVNDIYEVSESVVLLGCDTGLYSYHMDTGEVVHIRGISNVRSFAVSHAIPKAILIGSDGEYLYQCDLRHLQSRAQASACLQPKLESFVLDLSIANRTHSEPWHIVRMMDEIPAGGKLSDAIAIAATSSRIVILKFDGQAGRFKPVRGLDTILPVSTVLFTKDTAIVGSDKFFEIDLLSFAAEEFLDMSDKTLSEVRNCAPLAAFRINSQEFLLCYREVGIFVDDSGWRSRPDNLNWLQDPVEFYYRESCLFVAHADCVQVMYISKSYTKELACRQSHADDERRAFISLRESPRLLAPLQFARTSIYVACECGPDREQEIVLLDGLKALRTVGFSQSLETLSSLATGVGHSQDSLSTLGQGV